MISPFIRTCWKKGWASCLLSAAAMVYLLQLSWLKWGDLIVDTGRELYVPFRLVGGAFLYRDISYLYGPFSPYFNALMIMLLGAKTYTFAVSGILATCAAGILIYKISRLFLDVAYSTFATLNFLFVFAFGYYVYYGNYNFILPYSYGAIHAIVFSLAALYLSRRSKTAESFRPRMEVPTLRSEQLPTLRSEQVPTLRSEQVGIPPGRGKQTGNLGPKPDKAPSSKTKYLFSLFIALALLSRIEIGIALILAILVGIFIPTLQNRNLETMNGGSDASLGTASDASVGTGSDASVGTGWHSAPKGQTNREPGLQARWSSIFKSKRELSRRSKTAAFRPRMESRRFGRDKSVGIPPRRGEEAGNLGLQPEGAPFFSLILALALALIVYGLFWGFSGDAIRRSNLSEIVFSNIKTSSSFTAWLTGTSELFKNAILLLKAFLGYGLLALFFFLGGLIWAKAPKKITAFLLSAFFLALVALFLTKYFNFELQFRCLPVIYLFTAGWSLKRKDALLFSLSIFSFLLSLRILFTCRAAHYGFYLLSPGIIIYYIFFLKIIPDFFQVEEIKKFFRLAYLFVFAWFALNHFLVSKFCYDHRSSKITTSRGELYVFDNQRERSCQELIEYLSSNTDQSDTLVVFPEGLTINFLSARDNPLYYYSFLPQDLAKIALSNELITELKDKQLTYIALVQRDTSEYGYPVFGRDYGRQVWDYIAKNFLLHKQFGPYPFSGGEFGVALFKNKLSYAQKQI